MRIFFIAMLLCSQQFFDESIPCQQYENSCVPSDSDFKDDTPEEVKEPEVQYGYEDGYSGA